MAGKIKQNNNQELDQKLVELTADLQRTRADFENFRKRSEQDKLNSYEYGRSSAILALLPVIDDIERACNHLPDDLKDNQWAQGIIGLAKNLEKSIETLGLKRIESGPGVVFNPDIHEAVQFDDSAEGEHEVIAEELKPGYLLNNRPIRHAVVRVTRQ